MRSIVTAIATLVGSIPLAIGQSAPQVVDLIRLGEAARLVQEVGNVVWPDWEEAAFPVLLVEAEREVLVGYPRTPPGFVPVGYSVVLQKGLLGRTRQFDPGLLATFPAFGLPPLVVIGRAEVTNKTSTEWVLTVLHEHFHQYQMADPGYFSAVDGLDLSGGDETGMWMLNYPFPYESAEVADSFTRLSQELASLLRDSSPTDRTRFWLAYSNFLESLAEKDRRYLSLQIWQEGMARYVELRVAEVAASSSYSPSVEFLTLSDAEAYSDVASRMRAKILAELEDSGFSMQKRVSFYAFGARLALLLDQDGKDWKSRYLAEKFFVERYVQ